MSATWSDPTHTYPPAVLAVDLQHAVMGAYGSFLHLEHVAEAAHHPAEASLAHDAAQVLALMMWPVAS